MRPQDVVLFVRQVHDYIGTEELPIRVTEIRRYITEKLQINFDAFDRVSYPSKLILGRLSYYEKDGRKSAQIYLSESLNHCWTRFVACKELAHLIIDKAEDCTRDPITLIRALIDFPPATIDADVRSEAIAIYAATELLIPWRRRDVAYQMIKEGKNNYEIALHFKVPEKAVDHWRSEGYQKLMTEAWEDI